MAMINLLGQRRRARVLTLTASALVMAVSAFPAMAQQASPEARIQRMESEIRALQRKVFPGGDGKYFTPEITPSTAPRPTTGQPATTPLTDILSRMDALEAQLTRLTSQTELNTNRISQIETRLEAMAPQPMGEPPAVMPIPAPGSAPAPTPPPASSSNLDAMTGGASAAKPALAPASKPLAATTTAPSSQRLTAVRAIEKPQTGDAADDEYSYGFRLWEAKFYPEAQQQLKLTVDRYPRHSRISYTRNLLGRAYLDDGKARDAATWFLQNYQANKTGERAPDSLLYLAESMRRLKDTNRACIALAEFGETYPSEAAGRLKTQYDQTRSGVKCN
jgi:TolA-binding protein